MDSLESYDIVEVPLKLKTLFGQDSDTVFVDRVDIDGVVIVGRQRRE